MTGLPDFWTSGLLDFWNFRTSVLPNFRSTTLITARTSATLNVPGARICLILVKTGDTVVTKKLIR